MIPVDKVKVVYHRDREKKQHDENTRSIGQLGLYKPILVNKRNFDATGFYDLICGEGRLLAHIKLGKSSIKADVWDVDDATAQLMSLGENIARTPPATIEFARAVKEMHDHGMSMEQLSAITGKCIPYLEDYLRLLDQGEERLIRGVEDGMFPLSFALSVAHSADRSIQHLLMDAFDGGVVNSGNLGQVRRIIEDRLEKGKQLTSKKPPAPYTVDRLKSDIRQMTKEKEAYVFEVGQRESRLMRILVILKELRADAAFTKLLSAAGLNDQPELKGHYVV